MTEQQADRIIELLTAQFKLKSLELIANCAPTNLNELAR